MIPAKPFLSIFNRIVQVGAATVIAIGIADLLGWLLNISYLKSVLPGLMTMKAITAFDFIMAGAALWLLHTSTPGSRSFRLGRVLAVVVALLSVLSLAEYIFALDLGIDQLILRDDQQLLHPGRMAETTAFSFLIVGISLFIFKTRRSRLAACVQWFTIIPLFISSLAIVGYVYGVVSLYEVGPYSSVALNTAIAFLDLSMSILAADPTRGIASIGASDTAGGGVARTLLPIMPLAIFVIGWARLEGQLAGLYDTRLGLALMVILSAAVCVLAITWTAFELRKVDLVRRRAEAKIAGLNAGLEELVQQRTEQVARLTAALSANKALELLSLQDCLTGVGNRRSFDQYLAGQTSIARRQKRTLALVMCDIDDFKAYNDHYGHQAGDACLKRVAAALRSICRRPADMTARYGGEEFALILPDTDLAGAILIAEAARDAVACLKIPHARSPAALHVSISGGVSALLPTTELTSWKLIADADEALFQAKRQGRNRMISAPAETKENLAAAKVRAVA